MSCPTCGQPTRSTLSGCTNPPCVTAEIAADTAVDLNVEASES